MKRLLNLLLPNRCVMTGRITQDSKGLSAEGFDKIQFITTPYCTKCGAQLRFSKEICRTCIDDVFAFQEARSAFIYDYYSKKLILQYKHGDRLSLSPVFAKWLVHHGKKLIEEADYLIPVPLHPQRLRKRMYNQAAELVKAIHKITHTNYMLDALIRIKPTPPQGHEDKASRIENMLEAFQVNPKFELMIPGKSILIIDDVMTTGATLDECARTLLPFEPKKISVLTLSKVLFR